MSLRTANLQTFHFIYKYKYTNIQSIFIYKYTNHTLKMIKIDRNMSEL